MDMKYKSSEREKRRHKRRFAPTLTNPGMRIILRKRRQDIVERDTVNPQSHAKEPE